MRTLVVLLLLGSAAYAEPKVVRMFEMRFGAPGTAHVVPECSCTFKYVGTRVAGDDYYVHFRKMD